MLKKIFKLSILFISMACHLKSFSFFADYQANKSYQNKAYQTAREILQKEQIDEPDNALINYNLGTIDYKLNKQESAKNNFQRAVNLTQDNQLKEKAYFNWGNSLCKNSQNILGKDWEQKKLDDKKIEQATKEFENAIEKYKNTLAINKENEKAENNLKAAEEFLKKLIEKKQQQQQKNNDQDNNQDNKDQQKNKDNQDQQKQNDSSQNQQDSSDQRNQDGQKQKQEGNKDNASEEQKEDKNNGEKDKLNEEKGENKQEKIDKHDKNFSENEDQQAQPEKEGTQQQEENQALREEEANTAEAAAQEQATEETTDLKKRELITLLEKLQDDESKMQKQIIWQKSKSQKNPQNNTQKPW